MTAPDRWCAAFPGREAVSKGLDSSFYKDCRSAKLVFEEAGDYFATDMAGICYFQNDIQTQWVTICLVTHCYAVYSVAAERYGLPVALAGYSQGEFTACAASGAVSFTDILGLIYRLERILEATKTEDECMYRLVDIDIGLLEKCCEEIDHTGANIKVSAYISDAQNIISGERDCVEKAIALAKKHGARWAIDLNCDRAYHSPLCREAAEKARWHFGNIALSEAKIPVYSCYDGEKSRHSAGIVNKLSKQIDNPIRWKKIIKNLITDGVTRLVEPGPGCTVSANSRISDERMNCVWIGSVNDL